MYPRRSYHYHVTIAGKVLLDNTEFDKGKLAYVYPVCVCLLKHRTFTFGLVFTETVSNLAKLFHTGTCVLLHLLTYFFLFFFFLKAASEKKEEIWKEEKLK